MLIDVLKLGGLRLALVVLELIVAIAIMVIFSRIFGLGPKLTALLAVGSSICGVSAIIATQGAIDADDEDASFAIAAIWALGAFGLFAYPLIGHALHLSDHAFGVWAGLAVDNTAEASAAGALYSEAAGKVAVLTKTACNAMIGCVVLGAALLFAARAGQHFEGSKTAFVWRNFPNVCAGVSAVLHLGKPGGLQQGMS
nr:putative sulfate exporter family transporter [Kallotenue papyrolyticum]